MPAGSTGAGPIGTQPALIDVHCHVFNGSDLPAIPFLYRVVRERYDTDPDGLMPGIGLILEAIAGNAPRAADELADLLGKSRPPRNGGLANSLSSSLAMLDDTVGSGASAANSGLLSWLKLFALSRRELVARLAGFYAATSTHCELIAPAIVDYNTWLENPDKEYERLTDQVAVMGELSRRPGKPRVHGFVGFDPIRAILAPNGYNPAGGTALPTIDPHRLVREAITQHGFLGVKLYPPMGFRAWNNGKGDISFSKRVKKYVELVYSGITDRQLGRLIDQELEKLYEFCASEGVPILAHAYNSNQADECYGWRASPQYWGEVIDKFSTDEKPLRICLGHFGSFSAHKKNTGCVDNAFASKAWETIFAGILTRPGGKFVFADLSYLSEIIDRSQGWQQRRKKIADQFKSFMKKNKTGDEHLCYGSDWVMLGLEQGHERYHLEMRDFLQKDVGLEPMQLANIFFGNALGFLGLRPGDQNRARLEKFYHDHNIGDFPQVDALV